MAEIIIPKKHMFAIEGQIYETDSILEVKAACEPEQYTQLVRDTTFQIAFLEALKIVMPKFASIPGVHPNLKNMAKFEEDDEKRLQSMKDALELLAENDPLLAKTHDVKKLKEQVIHKMLNAMMEIPDAWTEDGKLKPEFIAKYRSDIVNLSDL
jgi:hypothetical protein